jgi:hypothetical protein
MDWVQRSRLVEQQRVAEANAKGSFSFFINVEVSTNQLKFFVFLLGAARAAQSKPKQASYSSAALAGIRIRHGASELTGTDEACCLVYIYVYVVISVFILWTFQLAEEGVVLTLKDERIIDADTGDVNVAEDELENIDLVEKAKTKVCGVCFHSFDFKSHLIHFTGFVAAKQ